MFTPRFGARPKRNAILLFWFLSLKLTCFAFQNAHAFGLTNNRIPGQLKGRVVDTKGDPIAFAIIEGAGISAGTECDGEGRFSVWINEENDGKITFRSLGKRSQTITSEDIIHSEELIVVLFDDVFSIEEVVVTGYSEEKQRDVAGSVVRLNLSDIRLISQPSVDKMLTGQIPGVSVTTTSGEPGATPSIRIRGISSIHSIKSPLWVLDGIILDEPVALDPTRLNNEDAAYLIGNAIAGINPNDIETITVLKDASAAALYGVQAANGVIVITTKRGEEGPVQVRYNASLAFSRRPSYRDFDRMNSADRVRLSQEIIDAKISYGSNLQGYGYENLYLNYMNGILSYDDFYNETVEMAGRNTDWYDLLFRHSRAHRHSLSLSGGNTGVRYYGSLGFDDDRGTARSSGTRRYSLMMKADTRLSRTLTLSTQFNGSFSNNNGYHFSVNPNDYAYNAARTIPAYDKNGDFFFATTRKSTYSTSGLLYNILRETEETGNDADINSFVGKAVLNWKVGWGFEYELTGSFSSQQYTTDEWATSSSYYAGTIRGYNEGDYPSGSEREDRSPLAYGGIILKSRQEQKGYMIRNKVGYHTRLNNDHVFSAASITEIRSTSVDGFSGTYYGWTPERGNSINPKLTSGYLDILSSLQPHITSRMYNYVSWLAYAAYNWRDKITLNANVRGDGSNQFGENSNYRFLPVWSVAAKYTLSQEPFMRRQDIVSHLAVRASYGIQGNVDKQTSPDLVVRIGAYNHGTDMAESYFEYLPNPDLKWEKTTSHNLGLDFGLWDNRVSGTAEYYRKMGVDMIMSRQVSQVVGMQYVKINAGKIRNSGVELGLNAEPIRQRDWGLHTGFVLSYNRNILVSANNDSDITLSDMINGSALLEGKPLGTFYSYRFAGLNPETGYPVFYDNKGNDYIEIDGERHLNYALYDHDPGLVESGQLYPTTTGGFNIGLRFKRLRFDLGLTYSLGGHNRLPGIYGGTYSLVFSSERNLPNAISRRWRNPGDEAHTTYPVLFDRKKYADLVLARRKNINYSLIDGQEMYDYSDLRVAATDNLRVRNVSVNYRLPDVFVNRYGMKSMDLTFETTNLWVFANKKWNGMDPESGYANTPVCPTYSLGINIHF